MILFQDDWKRYPYAQPDYTTKNITFLRTAGILKMMGVENSTFLLALHNQDLKDIDPHDPNLTLKQQMQVTAECRENPWYFFREVSRVSVQGSHEAIRYKANRANISMLWLFFNHITTLLIQPRQTGKSVSTDLLMVYLLTVGSLNTDI